jgi:hypothetical protein
MGRKERKETILLKENSTESENKENGYPVPDPNKT